MQKYKHKKLFLFILFVLVVLAGVFFIRALTQQEQGELSNGRQQPNLEDSGVRPTNQTASTPPTSTQSANSASTVSLREQSLVKAPASLFSRSDIQVLDLSYNNLTSLQAEIRNISALRVLDLSHNILTNIPAELGQLANLEILNLSYNKLTGLPYELGNLQKLKILDLRGNNYAKADLDIIRKKLPVTVSILSDIEPSTGGDAQMEYPVTDTSAVAPKTQAKIFAVSATNYSFDVKEIKVNVGDTVTINFSNTEGFHDWVIDEFRARTPQIGGGKVASITFVASKAGTFEYYCSVGRHRAMGMVGKLIVE